MIAALSDDYSAAVAEYLDASIAELDCENNSLSWSTLWDDGTALLDFLSEEPSPCDTVDSEPRQCEVHTESPSTDPSTMLEQFCDLPLMSDTSPWHDDEVKRRTFAQEGEDFMDRLRLHDQLESNDSQPVKASHISNPPTRPDTRRRAMGNSPRPDMSSAQEQEKHQCWQHGCNGRVFASKSNLSRHQRERSSSRSSCYCHFCGAVFTRTTARNQHVVNESCGRIRRHANGRQRPLPVPRSSKKSQKV